MNRMKQALMGVAAVLVIAQVFTIARLVSVEKQLDAVASDSVSHTELKKVAEQADDAMRKARDAEDTAEGQRHTVWQDVFNKGTLTVEQARHRGLATGPAAIL